MGLHAIRYYRMTVISDKEKRSLKYKTNVPSGIILYVISILIAKLHMPWLFALPPFF